MTIEKHWKTKQLAALLSLHPDTVRRAAQRGELPSVRIGHDRLYAERDVQRWLESRRDRRGG